VRCYDRLCRQADITYVRRRGRRVYFATFVAYVAEMRSLPPCVAITVSKAVGKAVVRNRIRRQLRAALDMLGPILPARTGLLLVVRPEAAFASYERFAEDIARVTSDV
jgi:ribonuclease P protein component